MLTGADVRDVVYRQVGELLAETGGNPPAITGEAALHDLGADSLTLARLIIQLEAELGVDPFASDEITVADVRSVDDLVNVYRTAIEEAGAPEPANA